MQWLKQSTAATIKLGPFVDEADGFTAENALTIEQADIRLSKNGGDMAQTNNAAGATFDEIGYYDVPLDTTDTNTLGRLLVAVHKAGARPVVRHFMVVPANVWDSMFGADKLEVDLVQSGGSAVAAGAIPNAAAGANGGLPTVDASNHVAGVQGDTKQTGDAFARLGPPAGASVSADIAAVKSDTAAVLADTGTDGVVVAAASKSGYALSAAGIQAIWDALTSALTTAGSIGKRLVDYLTGDIFARLGPPAGASVSADIAAVKSDTAAVLADTNDLQSRIPAALVGGRIDASVGAMATGALAADALAADAAAEIADAVWDEALGGHAGVGSAGKALADLGTQAAAIKAKTDNLPASPAAVGSAMTLTAAERTSIADALLDRDMSAGADTQARSPRNALRRLRNKVTAGGGTMSVKKENDTDDAWTAAITADPAADPITGIDPS